jgi:RHS repeat-associated protein
MSIRARLIPRAIETRTSCSRPDKRSSIIKGFATILGLSFLLLASLASVTSAQECITCNDDKPVKIGFTASVCSAHDYTVSVNGTSVEGIGSCTANSWMTTNKAFTYLKTDVTYQITAGTDSCSTHIVFDVPPKYTLEIDGVKTNTIDKSGGTTKGSGDGTWNVVIRKCRSCGEAASSCELDLDSVNWAVSMGRLSDGRSAEAVSILESAVSSSIYTPAALVYSPPGQTAEVDVVRNAGILRQIKASQALADVVVTSASEYEVRFYRLADVGTKTGGLYPVFNQPFTVWRIKNPDPTTTTRLQILKIQNGVTLETNEYTQDALSNTWSLNRGGGTMIKSLAIVYPTETTRIETTIVKESNGQIVSKIARTYHTFAWGDDLMKEVVDPDGAALTTVYTYYENPAQPGRYGHLQSISYADGSWEKSDYDTGGNLVLVMRPWKDLTLASATEANARSTRYTYSNSDGVQVALYAKHISSIEEKIAGTTVSKTTYSRSSTPVGGEPAATEVQTVYASATSFQTTSTTTYHFSASTFLANRVASVIFSDGRQDTYTYEKGNYVVNVDPSLTQFTPDSNGQSERTTIVRGTTGSPNGIAFKTDKETTVRDQSGRVVLRETYAYDGINYERIGWMVTDYDDRGHVVQTRNHKGQRATATWSGDLKISETDATGVQTDYTYDALNRVRTQTKKGIAAGGGFPAQSDITTTFTYDAESRQILATVSGGGLSLSRSNGYDLAGRLIRSTDQAGLSTTYSYSNGGRTENVTLPGGATQVTDKYFDGQGKSVTGTAAVALYYDYGVNAGGTRYKQEFMGNAGLSSPRWAKTTTNWVGRIISGENLSLTGTFLIRTSVYNNNDQLQSESLSAGGTKLVADKLYEYDALGNQIRSGADIDESGTLTLASTDRIMETDLSYEKVGGEWFQVTSNRIYLVDNDATPTIQVNRERLTTFALNGADQTVNEVTVTDVAGNNTVTTTTVDRAARKVTTTTDAPDSNVNAVSITVNGLIQSATPSFPQSTTTYGYDALSRQTSINDPRTGTTTSSYSPTTGQLLSTNDGAGSTSYEYNPGSHVNAGRIKAQTNAVGKKVYFNYSARGEVVQTWGDTTYPVEYVFDSYGQRTEMHTFRNGLGWTGTSWPSATTGTVDVTKWIYQESTGLLLQKQDPALKGATYTYDELGRLKTRTWARLTVCTYGYDPKTGELRDIAYSDSTPAVAVSYDRGGGQTNITDAGGARTRTYNVGGELQTEQITGGILDGVGITVGYDGLLRRSSLQTSQGVTTLSNQAYGYDPASRLETITSGSQTASYAYYPTSGLLNTTTFTGGTNIARNYDALGRLQSIVTTPSADGPQSYVYTYNNLHQRTRATREDGSYWSYIYNDRGEVFSGKKFWPDNSPVWGAQTEHNFDNIGNRNYAKTGGNLVGSLRQSTYTANSLNQYTQRTVPGALDITGTATSSATVSVNDQASARKGNYFYKEVAVDNIASPVYSQVKVVGARNNFGAGGEDAVTEKGGRVFTPQSPEASTYDLDGNLIGDGRWIYSWDGEDRLISMETIPNVPVEAKQRLEFAYDYMSRRIQKKVYRWDVPSGLFQPQFITRFVYDGWNLIAEIDGNNSLVRSYVRNGADLLLINGGGDVHQVGYDGNENLAVLVKASTGRVSASFDYDPFGQTLKAAGEFASQNPFRFSNQYTDGETGLVYYGYRYYNPQIGRWISRDPSAEAGGANLYGFLGNDSINGVDSLGLWRRVDMWSGGRSVYSGSVEAECNDNLRQLAILITGDPNDWKKLKHPEKVQAGEIIKVGKLLAELEEKVRYSIVAATRRFNPAVFSVTNPSQGASAEDTVNQYFTGTKFGPSDCSTAELLVRAKGVIDVLKPGEFNELKLTYRNIGWVEIDGTAGQMLLGDAGAILNYSDYSEWSMARKGMNMGYKAENIIKVGPGNYWGFEGPEAKNHPRSELQWRKDLRQHFNDLGGPQRTDLKPIHFAGKIRFVNIPYLGMVVFDLRASKLPRSQ